MPAQRDSALIRAPVASCPLPATLGQLREKLPLFCCAHLAPAGDLVAGAQTTEAEPDLV
jgi:hypothetical protein